MPIDDYHGETFVAFVDISGFKALMKNREDAYKALSRFYQIGYDVLGSETNRINPNRVDGIFISDCGVLFSRCNGQDIENPRNQVIALGHLLEIIESISKRMIADNFMLTASISFGQFDYHERANFVGIEKNLMLGNAYLEAYLDNEVGKPKLEPGQCRIVNHNQDNNLFTLVEASDAPPFNRVVKNQRDSKHLYFYWMVPSENEIDNFTQNYKDAYNQKYSGMLKALRMFANNNDVIR
ncbi:hypothetical protein [Thiovibrio frasassiensis]|uniref:Uncharacterized protein n=1 Tax=Thiovibrio frasassiensis TaxID=2984131 RepID=A0A9X4MC19_9BACT|nr:hypothetical protein [Thiovibrio frasassiensis]MDG4474706.1 hypothetical protein [Thiovibrio frasassiensis]